MCVVLFAQILYCCVVTSVILLLFGFPVGKEGLLSLCLPELALLVFSCVKSLIHLDVKPCVAHTCHS